MTRAHPGLADAELVNLANLAEHHVGRKNYQLALDLANEAAALAERQKKITTKGVILTTLAMAQAGLGEPDKGIATMQQAVALLRTSGAHNYLIDALEQQAAIYENSGRHREALAALREFNKEQKEATRKERDKVLAEAQEKFSAERKDLEIERLSLESGRRKAEVDARDWRQRLWATVAVALALGTALLVQMVSRARRRNRLLEDSNAVLSDQSVHDPLTGAFNRRHCVSLMDQHQATLAARPRERLSSAGVGLMLIDVDHFKHINDTHGHAAGDEVLVEIARRLQDLVRQHDVVVRWGGEEFVLVLQRTPTEGLPVLAERVLKVVGQAPVLVGGQAIPVSISAGCASYPMMAGQPWQDCLKVADAAMYLSKQQGRNRAICVMAMREGLTSETLVADLARARDAGDITLQVVRGPVQQARDAEAMGI
jgi:diguanylate cyclase (GGDEF)-like protein